MKAAAGSGGSSQRDLTHLIGPHGEHRGGPASQPDAQAGHQDRLSELEKANGGGSDSTGAGND